MTPLLSDVQFSALTKLIRSRGASQQAARRVLVDGLRVTDAVLETGLSQPAVSQAVRRYRNAHVLIQGAYVSGDRGCPPSTLASTA